MVATLQLGSISVDVVQKDIKNVHLSVYPPTGRVRISAPLRMNPETIRIYAISKLSWIKRQQKKVLGQERESPREFIERESHYLWGKRYLLHIVQHEAPPRVELAHHKITLYVRPATTTERRQELFDAWYRQQLRAAVQPLLAKWERAMGVKAEKIFVQRMKTKWGSCSPKTSSLRLNTDLAKKPIECLEYIVVHEMAHLIEPTHNHRFTALMDRLMPNWRMHRDVLNRLPVRHETWEY